MRHRITTSVIMAPHGPKHEPPTFDSSNKSRTADSRYFHFQPGLWMAMGQNPGTLKQEKELRIMDVHPQSFLQHRFWPIPTREFLNLIWHPLRKIGLPMRGKKGNCV